MPLADAQALVLALGPYCKRTLLERCVGPDKFDEPDEDKFALWQLADELATGADKLVLEAFTVAVDGRGGRPSEMQVAVSVALRAAASQRLKIALECFESH